MALAECESALRQYVHGEYFLAAVEGQQGIQHDTANPFRPIELPDHPARPTVTHL